MRVGRRPRARLALDVLRILFERGIEMHPTLFCRRFHVQRVLAWELGKKESVFGTNVYVRDATRDARRETRGRTALVAVLGVAGSRETSRSRFLESICSVRVDCVVWNRMADESRWTGLIKHGRAAAG